ncbi:hypothetical protein EP47_01560 [Legionella norrlandica]|uniref:LepB N-terminal domain-containing protein n=1 Tax=Legionella norrlandica TaxID=1498499 RepID=A0A0A2SRV0_9GAMM|nr:hypothetical protein [Legionella norrlandica]KGP62436.1 hypothetical protein EP47_01560 [Legionella norrlandica]
MAGEFPGFGQYFGPKVGGIHSPDPAGGIFKTSCNTFLIKRDNIKPANDIAEFIASRLFEVTAPEFGAEVFLTNNVMAAISKNNNPFIGSKFFKNYEDLYKSWGNKRRSSIRENLQTLSRKESFTASELAKKNDEGQYIYSGYEQIIVSSLLIGDFSLHSGNIGVATEKGKKRLVRIDFGASFKYFTPEVSAFQSISNRFGFEKNYLKHEHPKERIFCHSFSQELRRVATIDLTKVVFSAWNDVSICFNKTAIESFGKRINFSQEQTDIGGYILKILKERQASLIKLADIIDNYLVSDPVNQKKIMATLLNESQRLSRSNSEPPKPIPVSPRISLFKSHSLMQSNNNNSYLSDDGLCDEDSHNATSNQIK